MLLDLRDHVVLAAAVGLCAGSVSPVADGAAEVAALSAAAAALPCQRAFTEEEIAAGRLPFAMTPRGQGQTLAEARLNWPLWVRALGGAEGKTAARVGAALAR